MLFALNQRVMQAGAILLWMLVLPVSGQDASENQQLPDPNSFHLFVLAGQSNMAGRGRVSQEDRVPHDRVWMWTAEGRWAPAVDPMHYDKPSMVGVGPGRSFGMALAEAHTERSVGLIPCAVGGSPIESWSPGALHQSTKTHPYDDAVARIQAASKHGTIQGILWHQGESDSNSNHAEAYHDKLLEVLKRLRAEVGRDVPILIGQLGQFTSRPWNEYRTKIDAAHQQIAAELPLSTFVSSTGLLPKSDNTHFNRDSAIKFGLRYYKAYEDLCRPATEAKD